MFSNNYNENNNNSNNNSRIDNMCLNNKNNHNKESINIQQNPITDYQKFKSLRESSLEFQNSIRAHAFYNENDILSLGVSEPSQDLFPIEEMKFKVKNFEKEIVLDKNDIIFMQSYSRIPGHSDLINWLINLQKDTHGLQNENLIGREWKLILTHGAQGALDCIFKSIFNRNDTLLTEQFTYGGVFGFCDPHGVRYIGIEMDERGIIPRSLENELNNWNLNRIGFNFPKAVYLIPNAQNPTCAQYDLQRKTEIYNICSKYNILIIEDDPNIFIRFEGKQDYNGRFIGEPSFLSIDIDKRVVRLDTFSKLLSSGFRFGFITTWKELYTPIAAEIGNSLIHTSNISQIVIWKLLNSWGLNGFYSYVKRNQQVLIQKRNYMKLMFDKYLNGLVEYNIPTGGLCFWVRLLDVDCSNTFITNYLYPNKILLNMGINFSTIPNHKTPYCRLTYTTVSNDQLDQCFKIIQSNLIKYKNDNKK